MGAGREDAAALTDIRAPGRAWPLIVRPRREEDRDAVLGFATRTWHDWDYIPNAWPCGSTRPTALSSSGPLVIRARCSTPKGNR